MEPQPDTSRTLRRMISYASMDTVCPPKTKGIRRHIVDITDNLKNKSTKKRSRDASNVPKNAISDTIQPSKRGRKASPPPLRDASQRREKERVLAVTDRLHRGIPSERESIPLDRKSNTEPLLEKGGQPRENDPPLNWILESWKSTTPDVQFAFQPPQIPRVDIDDVQLVIRPFESDVTIWDGLETPHHLFKCRLFLRCTTHPYDSVPLPTIPRVEMDCNTYPVAGSRYARPPIFQSAYLGASPGCLLKKPNRSLNVNPAAGIHMDRFWRTIYQNDGTWGWYRDAYVPLSSQLFDKVEYREFRLMSRVWLEEECLESAVTFGVSILLREVEMR